MSQTDEYRRARGRAQAKFGFFVHGAVFVAVMALLVIINMITSPDAIWFIWPLIGWGLALALHAVWVFLFADRDSIIDAMTEQELQHQHSGNPDERT